MSRLSFVLVLVLLTLTSIARADDVHYYDVETIIFESLDPAARNAENWKAEVTPLTVPPISVDLGQPFSGTLPAQYDPKLSFKPLPASEYKLNDAEKLMVASKQYRILLHTAWVQPGMGLKDAIPVHISQSFLTQAPDIHSLIPATPDEAAPTNVPAQASATQTRSVLNGYIKIILTRYLHAEVNLRYTTGLPLNPATPEASNAATAVGTDEAATQGTTPPSSESLSGGVATRNNGVQPNTVQPGTNATGTGTTSPASPAPVTYVLHQERKMHPNVLHYLDHPVLGVLLLITRHASKDNSQPAG